jgi:hypothetical protein
MVGHTIVHWWKRKKRKTTTTKCCSTRRWVEATTWYTSAQWLWLRQTKWVPGTLLERIAQMRKSLFSFFLDILCVAVCVVFRWDQRAKSTSWAVRRVALPVCLDTIPSKCWEKQTSLPSHLLATWRIHFFGSTVPTLSTLLAESDCTIKGKKKKYEKNLFLLLLFFGGRLANLHRIFF